MSKNHHKKTKIYHKQRKGQISVWDIAWLLGALFVVGYGAHGVAVNDLSLPARYSTDNFHEHGVAAWLTFGALICAAIGMLRNIDGFTKQANPREPNRIFPKLLSVVGWGLFTAGVVVEIFFSGLH